MKRNEMRYIVTNYYSRAALDIETTNSITFKAKAILSVDGQKGAIAIQRCSVEQKGAIAIESVQLL